MQNYEHNIHKCQQQKKKKNKQTKKRIKITGYEVDKNRDTNCVKK